MRRRCQDRGREAEDGRKVNGGEGEEGDGFQCISEANYRYCRLTDHGCIIWVVDGGGVGNDRDSKVPLTRDIATFKAPRILPSSFASFPSVRFKLSRPPSLAS
jgi:hypothetical protein